MPPVGQADLSDSPPAEQASPGWPHALVPNFSEWKAGDLVLVQGSWPISAAQLASLSRPNRAGRAFTHAGIYAGQGELIDAMPSGGIAVRQLWAYAQARTLAVRRLPSISDQERLDIVPAARLHVGKSYGWWAAVASKLIRLGSWSGEGRSIAAPSLAKRSKWVAACSLTPSPCTGHSIRRRSRSIRHSMRSSSNGDRQCDQTFGRGRKTQGVEVNASANQ